MKKYVIFFLSFLITMPIYGSVKKNIKERVKKPSTKKLRVFEEPLNINTHGPNHQFGPIPETSRRDDHWSTTLIDSSHNGFGGYSSTTNPLAYSLDEGYVAVYRQWRGLDAAEAQNFSTGVIGASQSEDGLEWFSEQGLNTRYPTGQQEPALPTGSGYGSGRYPSAGFVPDGSPTAIWNEYTNVEQGGGVNGGYPLYTYDSQGIGEFSAWVNPYQLNNGCNILPCDPPDLWVGNASVTSGDVPQMHAIYRQGLAAPGIYHMISSTNHFGGFFIVDDPYIIAEDTQVGDDGQMLWLEGGGYTSEPDYHINGDGVGYMVQIGWAENPNPGMGEPGMHTFFFKKTEDYGLSWSNDGGFRNTGYHFLPDEAMVSLTDSVWTMYSENTNDWPQKLWYAGTNCDSIDYETGDTLVDYFSGCGDSVYYQGYPPLVLTPGLWMWYDPDVRTDNDGGIHLVVPASPLVCHDTLYSGLSGCDDNDGDGVADSTEQWPYNSSGHYYFYNPDPVDNPSNWSMNILSDYDSTNNAEWDLSETPPISDPWYYMYPEITLSAEDESQVLWYAGVKASSYTAEDTTTGDFFPTDTDIFMRKSSDLGKTWTELENVTKTPGSIYPNKELEASPHLATYGTDSQVGVFYQMADFNTTTCLGCGPGWEDYMQRLYVGIYTNESGSGGTVSLDDSGTILKSFNLNQNYPNPFNPNTLITYDIEISGNVTLELFDIRGAKIKTLINDHQVAGAHSFSFDGANLSSGMYFYSLTSNGMNQTRKLLLMK